ncbi:MAG: DUF2207 domain-containing protein, partial [Fusobacteriaceae bacterium]
MKRVKGILALLFLLFNFALGENGYLIKNYRIDIDISADNRYSVKESITADFQIPKRGIIRSIPSRYGSRDIGLKNIDVKGAPYSSKNFSTGVNLRIGDPNRTITGLKDYLISYSYNMGWDRIAQYDEVYYNLIGNEWDTSISRVEFLINLPENFDSSKVNFTVGSYGSTDSAPVKWEKTGNSIKGYTVRALRPGEALTLALALPEGYFQVYKPLALIKFLRMLTYFLSLLLPLLGGMLWYKYRNDSLVEPVEFYPPREMNPSQVGYYIDGSVDEKDITSLIFYWADKGYLDIEEEGENGLFSKKEYILNFKKNMEEKNSYEPYFFGALRAFATGNSLPISHLKNRFYQHIERTARLLRVDLAMGGSRLYTGESIFWGSIVKSSALLLIILPVIVYALETGTGVSAGLLEGVITLPFRFPLVIISIVSLLIIGGRIRKRTDEYSKILGEVRGFKQFLLTAEKDKLEMLIDENPSYFYNILPYTLVLGVSDKWADKFRDLVKEPPQWYHSTGGNLFTLALFMNAFNGTLSSLRGNM